MPISGKEMVRLYEKNGWRKLRQRGSHVTMFKEGEGIEIIPLHSELGFGIEKKLLKKIKRTK